MKTLTFFNEKGGVGKSSFTLLYASWLKYKHGVNVGVADFNFRLETTRKTEEKNTKDVTLASEEERWPIVSEKKDELKRYREKNLPEHGRWFYDQLAKGALSECELVLADFPGAFSGNEFTQVIDQKLLSYAIIPFDRNQQTIQCTALTSAMLHRAKVPHAAFINQMSHQVEKKVYEDIQHFIEERMGLPVLPDMISYTERMRKLGGKEAICRTLSFPDWEQPEFRGSRDLGLESLFIDITKELQKVPELPLGVHSNLSFVNGLEKKTDISSLKRQLHGTAFRDYEINA